MQHIFSPQICSKNSHTDTLLDPEKAGGKYLHGNKGNKMRISGFYFFFPFLNTSKIFCKKRKKNNNPCLPFSPVRITFFVNQGQANKTRKA